MFQRLAGRAISDPILLILVQLLNGFDNQDNQPQHGRDFLRVRDAENRKQREQGSSNDLNELQHLISFLRYRFCADLLFRSYQLIWSSKRSRMGGCSFMTLISLFMTLISLLEPEHILAWAPDTSDHQVVAK